MIWIVVNVIAMVVVIVIKRVNNNKYNYIRFIKKKKITNITTGKELIF